MTLVEQLKQQRTIRNENQTVAGRRFGVTQPTFARWERGMTPNDSMVPHLAHFLGVTTADVWQLVHSTIRPTSRQALMDELDAARSDRAAITEELG